MRHALRVLLAFIVAPLISGIACILVSPVLVLWGVLFGYMGGLIIGVPVYCLLRWKRLAKPRFYILSAAAIGAIPFASISVWAAMSTAVTGTIPAGILITLIATAGGALGGWVFWLIERPDRFEAERSL